MKTFTSTGEEGLDIVHLKGPKTVYSKSEANGTITYDATEYTDRYNRYNVKEMEYIYFNNQLEVTTWDAEYAEYADQETLPGQAADNPVIIDAEVNFEGQGDGTTSYDLDFTDTKFYRVIFNDGYYTNINKDISKSNYHELNDTDFQAFHFTSDDQLVSQSWIGQSDEAQYVTYNWIMEFVSVSGDAYTIDFTRGAAVGGGAL